MVVASQPGPGSKAAAINMERLDSTTTRTPTYHVDVLHCLAWLPDIADGDWRSLLAKNQRRKRAIRVGDIDAVHRNDKMANL